MISRKWHSKKLLRFIVFLCIIGCAVMHPSFSHATLQELSPVHRLEVALDDGSSVTVDNASKMADSRVRDLVLAADRSTQTSSPYTQKAKGLFNRGDRIFVSDYYIAWFDYTIGDGAPLPPRWPTFSRSGDLAGIWSLDPSKQTFRYPYSSFSKAGKDDGAKNIAGNWARNELIPGSNSPAGQNYWWDRYSPPLAHTIIIPLTEDASQYDLFGTTYSQKFSGSNFRAELDGEQQSDGVHYKNRFLMTSWRKNHANFKSMQDPSQPGYINASTDFICHEKNIEVAWKFSPTVNVSTSNILVYLWVAYTGQNSTACGGDFPAPTEVYGFPSGQSQYQYVATNWNGQQTSPALFPWDTAVPCSKKNVGIGVTPSTAPLQAGSSVTIGESPDMNFNQPRLQFVSLAEPNAGSGTESDPVGIPFNRLGFYYENNDQTYGIGLMRGPYTNPSDWLPLEQSKWYQVHYSISTSF